LGRVLLTPACTACWRTGPHRPASCWLLGRAWVAACCPWPQLSAALPPAGAAPASTARLAAAAGFLPIRLAAAGTNARRVRCLWLLRSAGVGPVPLLRLLPSSL